MARKVKYKPVSKDLEKMVKPYESLSTRVSIGMEGFVGEFFYISIDDLVPFRNQARQDFNEHELKELSESIKQYGIRQPLTVLKNEGGKYEVVSGERRLRAAKLIELTKVPCIILQNAEEADAVALIENIHRKDLHPLELGLIYKQLLEQNVFKNQEELSEKIAVSKSRISEYIKYSRVPKEVQTYIISHRISARDKLRDIVNAYEVNDINKMNTLLGLAKKEKENFSILRITSNKGEIKFQEAGIYKLSKEERGKLKNYLHHLADKIEIN